MLPNVTSAIIYLFLLILLTHYLPCPIPIPIPICLVSTISITIVIPIFIDTAITINLHICVVIPIIDNYILQPYIALRSNIAMFLVMLIDVLVCYKLQITIIFVICNFINNIVY